MRIAKLALGPLDNNVYVVACSRTGESIVVDASHDAERIVAATAGTTPRAILLTHGDRDHVDALEDLRARLRVPVGVHPADAAMLPAPPDFTLADGETVAVGDGALRVIHTPGHTPGSVCFHLGPDATLLSGDTLFPGGPGATRGDRERFAQIIAAIRDKLFVLPDETIVRPGHGADTTIGAEKPHLREWIDRGW
ncbi:MAG: MBL fold metallo-hydrolase [Chloroflexota bacterium]|nr:MBL fold metallo-hydrolase [Chloroflexota bacterium]